MAKKYLNIVLWIKIFYKSVSNTIKHDGIEHAGYLAFLVMLAIFPFLVFFASIIGTLSNIIDLPIVSTLTNIILHSHWASFIEALKPRILEISSLPPQKFLTIAILSAIWTSSSIFEAIRTTLNRAYNVHTPPSYIFRRLWSFFEFIVIILLIGLAVLILMIIPMIWSFFERHIDMPELGFISSFFSEMKMLRSIIMYIFGAIFLSYIYYFLPSRTQKFTNIIPGVVLVLVCWSYFSEIFRYYISYFPQLNMIYGSIAGIIISLLFFYFCSLIMIYGAEFNALIELFLKRKKR